MNPFPKLLKLRLTRKETMTTTTTTTTSTSRNAKKNFPLEAECDRNQQISRVACTENIDELLLPNYTMAEFKNQ